MPLPVVAIVGRPNVGKSSLLNALARRRIAIVDSVPGVTRDRLSAVVPVGEGYVELLDTGGFGIEDRDDLSEHVNEQIEQAMASADLVLFVVDARQGVQPLDRAVAERLRRQAKPVILVANKVDAPNAAVEVGELYGLGVGEPVCTSAIHRLGLSELLEAVEARLGPPAQEVEEPTMKLAIVGKRNVGKSTFINALAGAERVIVSEVPGTTRDSVDVRVEMDGQVLTVIDTAGLRRRSKLADGIEFYSQHRALRSIRRADVVLLMLDATVPVGRVEKRLARYLSELFKPTVIAVNKWDLAEGRANREDYAPYITRTLPELAYAPIVLTCATEGTGLAEAVGLAGELFTQARRRVGTGQLNAAVAEIVAHHCPKRGRTTRPGRIYFATQIAVAPPTVVLFVNDVSVFDAAYQRYLLNQLRDRLPFPEVPIRLLLRQRRRRD
ncbi:MAG: ribosome biogenesis GTPase Der [Planctomycetales bacterium 4484_123]|nr:MAG: ribosome biogenesis GTPase Der [Planctomycetales bacterium 4484_123]